MRAMPLEEGHQIAEIAEVADPYSRMKVGVGTRPPIEKTAKQYPESFVEGYGTAAESFETTSRGSRPAFTPCACTGRTFLQPMDFPAVCQKAKFVVTVAPLVIAIGPAVCVALPEAASR